MIPNLSKTVVTVAIFLINFLVWVGLTSFNLYGKKVDFKPKG